MVKSSRKVFTHPQHMHRTSPEQIKFGWVFIEDEHDSQAPGGAQILYKKFKHVTSLPH